MRESAFLILSLQLAATPRLIVTGIIPSGVLIQSLLMLNRSLSAKAAAYIAGAVGEDAEELLAAITPVKIVGTHQGMHLAGNRMEHHITRK